MQFRLELGLKDYHPSGFAPCVMPPRTNLTPLIKSGWVLYFPLSRYVLNNGSRNQFQIARRLNKTRKGEGACCGRVWVRGHKKSPCQSID
jgi:hypothetical protein